MGAVYQVTTDRRDVPAARFVADDLIDLGTQVASHLARHRVFSRAQSFDAEIGESVGVITQQGLQRPVHLVIRKES